MKDPSTLQPRQDRYESFYSPTVKKIMVQYDYRAYDGELFSCVKPTIFECVKAKEAWLKERGNNG